LVEQLLRMLQFGLFSHRLWCIQTLEKGTRHLHFLEDLGRDGQMVRRGAIDSTGYRVSIRQNYAAGLVGLHVHHLREVHPYFTRIFGHDSKVTFGNQDDFSTDSVSVCEGDLVSKRIRRQLKHHRQNSQCYETCVRHTSPLLFQSTVESLLEADFMPSSDTEQIRKLLCRAASVLTLPEAAGFRGADTRVTAFPQADHLQIRHPWTPAKGCQPVPGVHVFRNGTLSILTEAWRACKNDRTLRDRSRGIGGASAGDDP
jgi:hypothetical protein